MSLDRPSMQAMKLTPDQKIGIIRSTWHGELTRAMEEDAIEALYDAGLIKEHLFQISAPGSYEIPLLAQRLIERHDVDGVIAIGIIVQGETHHARLIAEAATHGLLQVQLLTGKPVINEILFVDDIAVAKARAVGKRGKGALAAKTLLHSLALLSELHS